MALYLWGSDLLLDGGDLAIHENCCCGENCNCCTGRIQGVRFTLAGVTGVGAECAGDFCVDTNGIYDVPLDASPNCAGDERFEWATTHDDPCVKSGIPTTYYIDATWNIDCTYLAPEKVWINWTIAGRWSGDVSGDSTEDAKPKACLDITHGSPVLTAPYDPHWCNWDSATASIEIY